MKNYNFITSTLLKKSTKVILTFIILSVCLVAKSNDNVFVAFIADQDLSLSEPVDYHIQDQNPAISNSTITLNNPKAWLFFDKVRPSEVKTKYLQYVKVNDEPFDENKNGRIAIYGNGTVLIPHSSAIQPLTVYTDKGFQGDSLALSLHTYYKNPDKFNNNIRSFKLKRGYMATLATSSDGTGYSRVFIADKEDLNFSELPVELSGNVSFMRTFEYQWVSKKGWCGWNSYEINLSGATWYYDWNSGGTTTENVEYTPIKQNAGWPSWSSINTKQKVSHLLGYNEPDHTEQANVSVDAAVANWPDYLESGLRLGAPATTNFNWLYSFLDKCDALNYRVDFVAIHAYWGGKTPQNWYNDLKYIHERTGRPIWITEWNNGANWTNEWWPDDPSALTDRNAAKQLTDLKAILNVLDTASFVERYAIYNWVEDARAIILNSQLTPAGEYYAQHPSEIAFNKQNEYVQGKLNYSAPELTNRYLTLAKLIKLSWSDKNNNLTTAYKLERKVNDGNFETIFETDDTSVKTYNDSIDSQLSGTISYRVSLKTIYGDYIASNQSSYYQLGGEENIKIANFSIADGNWNSCLISDAYNEAPTILMGIPTFNNAFGLTTRINAIQNSSFRYRVTPWNYQSSQEFTKTDEVALATFPMGQYNFGGLSAEIDEITEVSGDWVQVTFNQPFENSPVVFCTQLTNQSAIPTTPVIRNVSASGFEIAIRCEEAISSGIIKAETVSYLAIEPGEGAIDQKRIIVGATNSADDGITATPFKMTLDDRISEPAVFAALQTTSGSFASTLRYYISDENELTFLKQRELSGAPSVVPVDQLGWLFIDLSKDQKVGIKDITEKNKFHFYPNPASNVLYFDNDEIKKVKIMNTSGKVVLSRIAAQQINIENLLPGSYLINIDGEITKLLVY